MDIQVDLVEDAGIVFTAKSERAIRLFEERNGEGVKQFLCDTNPADVFKKFPKYYIVGEVKTEQKDLN